MAKAFARAKTLWYNNIFISILQVVHTNPHVCTCVLCMPMHKVDKRTNSKSNRFETMTHKWITSDRLYSRAHRRIQYWACIIGAQKQTPQDTFSSPPWLRLPFIRSSAPFCIVHFEFVWAVVLATRFRSLVESRASQLNFWLTTCHSVSVGLYLMRSPQSRVESRIWYCVVGNKWCASTTDNSSAESRHQ